MPAGVNIARLDSEERFEYLVVIIEGNAHSIVGNRYYCLAFLLFHGYTNDQKLSTGETEILLTDLYDERLYSLADLKKLYALRWGIETAFILLAT